MAYLNKTLLIGNLGKDPEIRVTQSGQKQAKFSLATTERYKDKTTGEVKDNTEWHNVVAWRTQADLIERLAIRKGISLFIEGHLTSRSWDDPSGQKKYTTEVVVDRFQILTPRAQGQSQGQGQGQNNLPTQSEGVADYDPTNPDDLPF